VLALNHAWFLGRVPLHVTYIEDK